MKFDLHIHSRYSDGHADVKDIIKAASKKGLSGIAITDHDTMKGFAPALRYVKERKLDMVIIPGAEVTTSEGHLLVLGVSEMPPKGRSPEETIEIAHDLGGIADVPHPFHPFRHALWRIPKVDAVEVYNSKHLFGIANARAKIEAKSKRISMVAGSDSHYAETVGMGVTGIEAESLDEVIQAILAGNTKILGRRTPPRYFIGNTVSSIRSELKKRARRS